MYLDGYILVLILTNEGEEGQEGEPENWHEEFDLEDPRRALKAVEILLESIQSLNKELIELDDDNYYRLCN